jgi:hypothetical protein
MAQGLCVIAENLAIRIHGVSRSSSIAVSVSALLSGCTSMHARKADNRRSPNFGLHVPIGRLQAQVLAVDVF